MRARPIGNQDVVLIRQAFEKGDSLSQMSKEFQIPRKQIWDYILNQGWERNAK